LLSEMLEIAGVAATALVSATDANMIRATIKWVRMAILLPVALGTNR
jgi:hypothetical protein